MRYRPSGQGRQITSWARYPVSVAADLFQTSGIDQISRAITQMEQVTQSSAANAEESAAAAEQLNAQADAMRDVVEGLRAMVDGSAGAGAGAKRPGDKRHGWQRAAATT